MNEYEPYEFDRSGYIVMPNFLSPEQVTQLSDAVDRLEAHALAHKDLPPRITAPWGSEYHRNEQYGYHVNASDKSGGLTLLIEDFFNFDPAFDMLVNEPKTMAYMRAIVQERPTINNSELRVRYSGNFSGTHMGGPLRIGMYMRPCFITQEDMRGQLAELANPSELVQRLMGAKQWQPQNVGN